MPVNKSVEENFFEVYESISQLYEEPEENLEVFGELDGSYEPIEDLNGLEAESYDELAITDGENKWEYRPEKLFNLRVTVTSPEILDSDEISPVTLK